MSQRSKTTLPLRCPDCGSEPMWCDEHEQWECSNGNCDHVGEIEGTE